jgi:phage tail sheath protein FI
MLPRDFDPRVPRISVKKISPQRYVELLEATLTQRTQWAAFERNGPTLWSNVCGAISDHLMGEWKNGVLLGTKPEQAFFVKCDRTTMTQTDIDNGRLFCLVGVAPVKPAEFVIIRIGHRAIDRKA